MAKWKVDILFLFILAIAGVLLSFDLFFSAGHSSWMDGRVHITSIAQFYDALKDGDFPVRWADGFANYGMPIPLMAHQIPSYVGAFFVFLTNDIITAFGFVYLVGAVLASILTYLMLRIWFKPIASFVATFLFTVTAYRIFNFYVREALPEFFAALTFPPVIMALHYLSRKQTVGAFVLLVLAIVVCALSHPMILFVGFILFGIFGLYFISQSSHPWKIALLYLGALAWGIGISAYYLIPLKVEIKYFYYGLTANHLTPHFLNWGSYFDSTWYYYLNDDIPNRGHFVTFGTIESMILLCGLGYFIYRVIARKKPLIDILSVSLFASIILIFFTLEPSRILYTKIDALSSIQFPWRMLSALVFMPSIILAYLLDRIKPTSQTILSIIVIALVAFNRFPELYSKNNVNFASDRYFKTTLNLHSTNMNTVWTAETSLYPVKDHKGAIIGGTGTITKREERNSWRTYSVDAKTDITMVDYTFYFPGWVVYIDGQPVPIEFQNPDYRGVITYQVPSGKHEILLRFEQTKVRKISDIVSLVSLALLGLLIIGRKYIDTKLSTVRQNKKHDVNHRGR